MHRPDPRPKLHTKYAWSVRDKPRPLSEQSRMYHADAWRLLGPVPREGSIVLADIGLDEGSISEIQSFTKKIHGSCEGNAFLY